MELSTLVQKTVCLNSFFKQTGVHSACTQPSLERIQLMDKQIADTISNVLIF